MFGQNNDTQNQPFHDTGVAPAPDNSNPPNGFTMGNSYTSTPADPTTAPSVPPAADDTTVPVTADPNPTDFMAPATPVDGVVSDSAATTTAPPTDQLLSMKQEALQQLTPLVGHLEQSPEEKFRTIMMMIQASDDHTKLGEAFEAAKLISDDKARAQALLDVINEINYFTQQNQN